MSTETKQIGMRMPLDLVEWLESQAAPQHRSFSSQINFIVAQAKEKQAKEAGE